MLCQSSLLPDKTALGCLFLSMKMAAFVDKSRKMCVSSIKKGVFMDENGKMSLPSIKRAVFMDEVRDICYICMI